MKSNDFLFQMALDNTTIDNSSLPHGIHSEGYIYQSIAEKWLLMTVSIVVLTLVVVLNGMFILVARSFQRLHTAHYAVLISYALCDIQLNVLYFIQFSISWAQGAEQENIICRLLSVVAIGILFCNNYHSGLIAFER